LSTLNKPLQNKTGMLIRVRGLVQGVGFRPFIYRLAEQHGISGTVINDCSGVLIKAWSDEDSLQIFLEGISKHNLPLARIDSIENSELFEPKPISDQFAILPSEAGDASTAVGTEAATCADCLNDSMSPFSRRYRYPFTNCTHCGPRLSIIKALPYDRCNTSMSEFQLCKQCKEEYESPLDRRYHAQPTACYVCGPRVRLRRSDGKTFCIESLSQLDELDAVATLLKRGEIIAVKGLGGFHLCCDASNDAAVNLLRQRKQRYDKPFALMARDLKVIRRYCQLSQIEEQLLSSVAAPIVLLSPNSQEPLSSAVAPGVNTLGFMLPYTPLHHLIMKRMDRPVVFTSGNLSDEPQCISNEEAWKKLGKIADYILDHDREIINRVDDSVVRVTFGHERVLRRSRGYAPAPIILPPGFNSQKGILAMGAELKNTFCLVKNNYAVLSQHIGDLKDALNFEDYKKNLELYKVLFQHNARMIAVDKHPDYLSTKLGRQIALEQETELQEIQHHHAHIASCLAENNWPIDGARVLGVVLDGLGYGDDGFWGGEFMFADYKNYERLGTFKPVALIGGAQAMRQPWRNTYAHIMAEMGWPQYKMNFEELELSAFLESKPLNLINKMLQSNTNVPKASSCGRLFDAVAAAIGICRESASYEGQAAIELEALVDLDELAKDDTLAYPFAIPRLGGKGLPYIEPLAMWQALLGDLILKTPVPVIAARFHKGLAKIIVSMLNKLSTVDGERIIDTIVLSGGVFQNKILLEQVCQRLENENFKVLTHSRIPANDGGIALGQALICAARSNDPG
jgi:hydrogenase maturation protein HypF